MTLAQTQPNGQPVSAMPNALDLQGGFPPLEGAPPISTSTIPHPTAAPFLEDTTTASVISQSITSGHLRKAARAFDSHFDSSTDLPDPPKPGHHSDTVPIGSRAHADLVQYGNIPSVSTPCIVVSDHQSFRPSVGCSIGLASPYYFSPYPQSTLINGYIPLFPPTPNKYCYAEVPPTTDPRQLLTPFDPRTLAPASMHDRPAQIGGNIPDICPNMLHMCEQKRESILDLCPAGPEYQMESQTMPDALLGWSQSQSPYTSLSDTLFPTSPSRFQVPPESPRTPALLAPSPASTPYGTPPVLGSPRLPLSAPSYSDVQHSTHPHSTKAATPVSQSKSRTLSYAEILSRDASSMPFLGPNLPQPISTIGPPIPATLVNQVAQRRNNQSRRHCLAPSRLCNVVRFPPKPSSFMDPTLSGVNSTPGPASTLPRPAILSTHEVQRDAGKVAYSAPNQVDPAVMTQRRMYSEAVKGKTKDPIQRVKVLHRGPSQPAHTSCSRPHNTSDASVDRRPRPHPQAGLPYPPSPFSNHLRLPQPPSSAGRSTPGGPLKMKFKGKRQGVDPCLRTAFDDGDPLKTLLDRILASDWCQRDKEEPIYGSQEDRVTTNLALPTLQMHKSILFAFVQACPGEDEFQCLICPSRLRMQRVLRHIRSHFDIRPFVCLDCPDCRQSKNPHRATSLEGLHEHVRTKAAGKLPCSVCGGLFGSQGNLNRHIQKQHSQQSHPKS